MEGKNLGGKIQEKEPSVVIIDYADEKGMGEPLGKVKDQDHGRLPFKHIGALEMECSAWKGRIYRGSGILISRNLVLTSAHNVWCGDYNQPFSSIKFYPGVCGVLAEVPCYECSVVFYPKEHRTSKLPIHDFALLQLSEPIPGEEDDFLPLSASLEEETASSANQKTLAIYGYPLFAYDQVVLTETFEARQWGLTRSKKVVGVDPAKAMITHRISTEEGQSGSPIIEIGPGQSLSIVGIHKGSVKAEVNGVKETVNVGRMITTELIQTLEKEIDKRRPRMFK